MPRIPTIYIVVRHLSGLYLLRKILVISTGYKERDPIIAIFLPQRFVMKGFSKRGKCGIYFAKQMET